MLKNCFLIIMIIVLMMCAVYGDNEKSKEWNEKGAKLYGEGQYEEAINCFNEALKIDGSVWQVWYNKGNAYYKLGQYEKACVCYNKVIEYSKEYMQAYYKKGICLNGLGRYEEALKYFNIVLTKNPKDNDALKGKEEALKGLENNSSTPTPCIETPTPTPYNSPTPTPYINLRPVGPEMVYIEGGTFDMGSNDFDFSKPVHSVKVSSFYISKYEVTNREYKKYDSSHNGNWNDDDYPVENVSWNEAIKYCRWLSGKTGKIYRLPTEAEWEYACRGGTTTDYYWGNRMDNSYCWYDKNSDEQVHSAGQKLPNSYGLYDMTGNVWEWCLDWYGEKYYSTSPSRNPQGPSSGTKRVLRGGGWNKGSKHCQSAYRVSFTPGSSYNYIGFRVVRVP